MELLTTLSAETFSYIFTDNEKNILTLFESRSREKRSDTDGELFNPSEGDPNASVQNTDCTDYCCFFRYIRYGR